MLQQEKTWLVGDVMTEMAGAAPPELAEPWDAVGLQIGSPADPVRAVVLSLDITPAAIRLADELQAGLVICHHPPIFKPLASLRRDDPGQALLMGLVEKRIAVLAAHTNLDAAPGGVADSLAGLLADSLPAGQAKPDVRPLTPHGRMILLPQPLRLSEAAGLCQAALGASGCLLQTDRDRPVQKLAVFPGSFAEESAEAVRLAGADCLVCGACRHSTGLLLDLSGIALVQVGHDVSEQVVLRPLAERLRERMPGLVFAVCPGLVYNDLAFRVSRTAAGVSRKETREESPGSAGQGAG